MTRACSVLSGWTSIALVAGLALGCGDDGSTTAATITATTTMTTTATAGMTMDTTEGTPTTTDSATATAGESTAGESTAGTTSDTGDEGGVCAHQCGADADCMVDGMDIGLTCQDSFCTGESSGCTGDAECVALFSGWATPCTAGGGECDALAQLCVQVPGGAACATPPGDFFMCESVPGWAEIMVPDIDGNQVTVCGNSNAECNADGFCFSPCQADADCASAAYPICDTGTGLCGCGSDADCATLGQPHLSACDAGRCGCASDQQCVDGNAGDVCAAEGFCGCSGNTACGNVENSFDGGAIACVKP